VDDSIARRFNLIDAFVLIAATAGGLALGRAVSEYETFKTRNAVVYYYAASVALAWTPALLALNLTRHRAPRRELACRPGFSVLVAVVVVLLADTLFSGLVIYSIELKFTPGITFPQYALWVGNAVVKDFMYELSIATTVAAVWLVTAMAGCWRPERTWIDRTGRAVGAFWLGIRAACFFGDWAFPE
jgi:hypothetical protein